MSRPDDFVLVLVWALSACYSAEEDGSVTLPFDLSSGALRDEVWRRWLERDPVSMVDRYRASLRAIRAVWLDAGRRDEHLADVATEVLANVICEAGAKPMAFELYDGAHGNYTHRFALSVRFLADRISPTR